MGNVCLFDRYLIRIFQYLCVFAYTSSYLFFSNTKVETNKYLLIPISLCTFYGYIKTFMCTYSIFHPYKSLFSRLIINYCSTDLLVYYVYFLAIITFFCVNTSAIIKYFPAWLHLSFLA